MYRVSPLTYLVSGILSTTLHSRPATCSSSELSTFDTPNSGQTCAAYLSTAALPGQLLNPDAISNCQYCPLRNADQFLAGISSTWETRWRNVGIIAAYIGFNVLGAVGLYYVFRVKRWSVGRVMRNPLWVREVGRVLKGILTRDEHAAGGLRRKETQPRAY